MLTDVDAVYSDWGTKNAKALHKVTPQFLESLTFEAGSMAPKVRAAITFAKRQSCFAGIGTLEDALNIVEGKAGTIVSFEG